MERAERAWKTPLNGEVSWGDQPKIETRIRKTLVVKSQPLYVISALNGTMGTVTKP